MAYCHLASEPFWLLAYHDPQTAISSGEGLSAKQIREQIRFAQLRKPFWDVLQKPSNRQRVLQYLQQRWLGGGAAINIATKARTPNAIPPRPARRVWFNSHPFHPL